MGEKSYVAVGAVVCPVCGKGTADSVLLHRRLQPVFDERQVNTGWGMCEEHQKLKDEGYIALIVIDRNLSSDMTLAGVHRLGETAHIKREVWDQIFNIPPPDPERGIAFIGRDGLDKLKEVTGLKEEEEGQSTDSET